MGNRQNTPPVTMEVDLNAMNNEQMMYPKLLNPISSPSHSQIPYTTPSRKPLSNIVISIFTETVSLNQTRRYSFFLFRSHNRQKCSTSTTKPDPAASQSHDLFSHFIVPNQSRIVILRPGGSCSSSIEDLFCPLPEIVDLSSITGLDFLWHWYITGIHLNLDVSK
ncbi:hypothetical protein MANES_01G045515v8 [Manihot esculenta]|uniref:Uncharacterized protein n=1 Tax=Manihot esculenta TaxID=3983 RepID=A0A2C9WHV8_MANES|nr:hypothetical protein MANES_01G045515v8 [Manihot esculenta]